MPDPDWSALYASEVLPAMEAFAQGPPMPVYVGMGVVVLVGVLTLVSYPGAEQAVAFALIDGVVVRGRHL